MYAYGITPAHTHTHTYSEATYSSLAALTSIISGGEKKKWQQSVLAKMIAGVKVQHDEMLSLGSSAISTQRWQLATNLEITLLILSVHVDVHEKGISEWMQPQCVRASVKMDFPYWEVQQGRGEKKQHNVGLMDGKLTVTLAHNESQTMTLCIIFMLMCTTCQLSHPTGKIQAFFVLYFSLSFCKTQTSSVFLCVCKPTKRLFWYQSLWRERALH